MEEKETIPPKRERKRNDFLFVLFILLVVVFMIFTARYMIINKVAFTKNPFIYGADKIDGLVSCSCTQDINEERNYFGFNDTDFWSASTDSFQIDLEELG